jgi:hypothetical protein
MVPEGGWMRPCTRRIHRRTGPRWRRYAGSSPGLSLVLAMALASPVAAVSTSMPRFHSEVVKVRVVPGELTVEGTYVFTNPGDSLRAAIYYPFPRDSLLGPPQVLAARITHSAGTPETLMTRGDARGWQWEMTMAREETCRVLVRYSQSLRARHAAYVLTSTQGWGRPLEHARLEVTLPAGARRPHFSHPFQRLECPDRECMWVLDKTRFMPRVDLLVDWEGP